MTAWLPCPHLGQNERNGFLVRISRLMANVAGTNQESGTLNCPSVPEPAQLRSTRRQGRNILILLMFMALETLYLPLVRTRRPFRYFWPARPSPIRAGSAPRPPCAPRRQPVPRLADTMPLSSLRGANIPTTVERLVSAAAPARHVAIAPRRIGSHPCCWPIGEPGTPAFRFCDDPAPLDVPYCDEHARLAYKPRPRRNATDEMLLAQLQ
jgi:hypothetical protein